MSDQGAGPGGGGAGSEGGENEDVRRFDDVPSDEEGEAFTQGPDTRTFDDEPDDDEGSGA